MTKTEKGTLGLNKIWQRACKSLEYIGKTGGFKRLCCIKWPVTRAGRRPIRSDKLAVKRPVMALITTLSCTVATHDALRTRQVTAHLWKAWYVLVRCKPNKSVSQAQKQDPTGWAAFIHAWMSWRFLWQATNQQPHTHQKTNKGMLLSLYHC